MKTGIKILISIICLLLLSNTSHCQNVSGKLIASNENRINFQGPRNLNLYISNTNDSVLVNKSKIIIEVVPNFEVMIVLFNLASSSQWVYTTPFSKFYINKQMQYFDDYKNHPAVVFTDSIFNSGYWLPAILDIAANCSDFPNAKLNNELPELFYNDLSQKLPIERVDSINSEFINLVNQFYLDTKFNEFISLNEQTNKRIIEEINNAICEYSIVKNLETFYSQKFNSYNLNPSTLLNGLAFGIKKHDSKREIHNIFPPLDKPIIDSISGEFTQMGFGNREKLLDLTIHEWGHSFVNPLTAKHEKKINKNAHLFNPIKEKMKKQGYGTWKTCMDEHLVRLGEIMILNEFGFYEMSKSVKDEYINERQFIYLPFLLNEFKNYNPTKIKYEDFLLKVINKMNNID